MKLFQMEHDTVIGEVHQDGVYYYLTVLDKATGVVRYKSINYKTPGRPVNKFYKWFLIYHL